jgi:hypothetical protein
VPGEALLSRADSTAEAGVTFSRPADVSQASSAPRSFRPSGRVDEASNPITVRRHHPRHANASLRPGPAFVVTSRVARLLLPCGEGGRAGRVHWWR